MLPSSSPSSPDPSPYAAYTRNLTPQEARVFLDRLTALNASDPYRDRTHLHNRCRAIKSAIKRGTIGNSAYGRSLAGHRGAKARKLASGASVILLMVLASWAGDALAEVWCDPRGPAYSMARCENELAPRDPRQPIPFIYNGRVELFQDVRPAPPAPRTPLMDDPSPASPWLRPAPFGTSPVPPPVAPHAPHAPR